MALTLLFLLLAQSAGPVGTWEGELQAPGAKLRLRLNATAAGAASLDSLDQGARGIPVEDLKLVDGQLTWRISRLGAAYAGTVSGDGFTGTFTQNGVPMKLDLRKALPAAPPKRPQTPKPPFPYRVEDVRFASRADGVKLAGTLTLPEGAGPHPGVVLISGSGPQDRDETLFEHKPFAVLADALTRRGIAVLRYDDRGTGQSGGLFRGATTADFAQDAEGAFDYLRSRKEVAARKSGLAGHSEGGVVAPLVAARRPEVAFVVLLAATGVPGDEVLYAQGEALLRANQASEAAIAQQRRVQEVIFTAVKSGAAAEEVLRQAREKLGASPLVEQAVKQASDPWFRSFLSLDPAVALGRVKCPVLALNGGLDRQVLPDQNLPAIEAALKKGGNARVAVRRFPRLNHLFQTAETGTVAEYGTIEETIAPVVLETIGDWLLSTTR